MLYPAFPQTVQDVTGSCFSISEEILLGHAVALHYFRFDKPITTPPKPGNPQRKPSRISHAQRNMPLLQT